MIYQKFTPHMTAVCIGLASVLALLILMKSLTPSYPSLTIHHGDKFIHVLAYLSLGAFVFPALPRIKPFVVWVGLCVFGGLVEIGQGLLNTGRTADLLDGLSNGLGAILALYGWIFISVILDRFNFTDEKLG